MEKKLFEQYIQRFAYDGKRLYFDLFSQLNKDLNYSKFEKVMTWVNSNKETVDKLLEKHKDIIEKNLKIEKDSWAEAIKKRIYALPTYENVTTYIGMFDES